MKTRRFFLITLIAALPLCAADKPNFTGKWKLNAAKSDFGGAPPISIVATVTHNEPVFRYEVTGEGAGGEPINEKVEFTADGKERETDLYGGGKMTAGWEGNVLVLKYVANGDRFSFNSRLSLAADGKTCIRDLTISGPDGESKRHEIYDKQ